MTLVDGRAEPLVRLDRAIAKAQSEDAFGPVTVTVPSAFARVQLRRALGARRGLCNVSFRTWAELTAELGRTALPRRSRVPTPSIVDEAVRQVLQASPSPLEALRQSAAARAELVSLLFELWRSTPEVVGQLTELGGRARAVAEALRATEAHLERHGFVDAGRLLDAAARADVSLLGGIVRWYPRPLRGRERPVLDHLEANGVSVDTIEDDAVPEVVVGGSVPCGDPDTEVRITVRAVVGAVHSGIPLFEQAIIHPPLDRYRRTVHQQLVAADVARCGPSPLKLADSATGRALTGLLHLADGRWSRNDVLGWLDGAPVTAEPGGLRPPVSRWDEISARAGVIEGLDQWRSRLERFAAGGSPLDVHVANLPGEADAALALARFVDRLAEELSQPGEAWSWSSWARWAHQLLDRHLDPDDPTEPWPAEEVVSADAVRSLLADLGGLDSVSPGCDLASFRHAVERELAARPIRDDTEVATPASEGGSPEPPRPTARSLPGPVGWGVFVGTPAEARGMAFTRVHLVGMADQYLPGPPIRASVMPDPDIADPDWPSPARAIEEVHDDVAIVTALSERSDATWPLIDPRTGRENIRSRWVAAAAIDTDAVSFALDVASEGARLVPLSPADYLLGSLVRDDVPPLDRRAPVRFQPTHEADLVPPLRESVAAAGLPGRRQLNRHDGWVGPQAAPLVDGELAPTSLEEYAQCPRRYLFSRQLRITKALRPEAIEEMDSSQHGLLTHEVLAAYAVELIGGGAPRSLERLLEIGRDRFAAAEAEGRCGPPVIAAVERSRLMSELRLFFQDDALDPVAVELAFGDPRTPEPEEVTERDDAVIPAFALTLPDRRPVRFRGRIDRIDAGPSATVVSDYKTGSGRSLKQLEQDPVAGGSRLQLVLYGLVARSLFADRPAMTRYWFTSPDREFESMLCEIDDGATNRFEEVVADIVTGIETGAFPGIPGTETYRGRRRTFEHCVYCDYDRVCPTDRDRRWAAAADDEAAAALVRLMGDPPPEAKGLVRQANLDLSSGGSS